MSENGDHVAKPATGSLVARGQRVAALTEAILDVQPELESEIDRFVNQALQRTDHVLRAISEGGAYVCLELGIEVAKLDDNLIKKLANGILDDRHMEREKSFNLRTIIITGFTTALFGILATLFVSSLTGPGTDQSAELTEFEGSSIVEKQHLSCYASQASWSGMEVVFTRRQIDGEIRWLADGIPVENQKIDGNILSGESTYTEFEPDDGKGNMNMPYGLRLDFVKGQLDVFTRPKGILPEMPEGFGIHSKGECIKYNPPME